MLIETTEELQIYVPTSSAFKQSTILAELRSCSLELETRVPKTLLTHLENLKGSDTLGAFEDIHYHFCSFLGNITMYRIMPKVYNSITGAGVRTHQTEETERATKWSYEEQRNAFLLDATIHLENGLSKLYSLDASALSSFMTADEIEIHKKRLFKNLLDWRSALSTRCSVVVIQELNHYVEDVEQNYILNRVGQDFWKTIKTATTAPFHIELLNYGRRIVASGALLRGLELLTMSLSADGLRMTSFYYNETLHGAPLSVDLVHSLKRGLERNITHYQGIFDKILINNAASIPGMIQSDFYIKSQENAPSLGGYGNDTSKGTFFI